MLQSLVIVQSLKLCCHSVSGWLQRSVTTVDTRPWTLQGFTVTRICILCWPTSVCSLHSLSTLSTVDRDEFTAEIFKVKVKALISSVLNGNPSQNYRVSLAIWDHIMLLATRHKRTHPTLTPAGEGWYWIYRPQRDGRLSLPRCLITCRWGIEPKTAGSEVRRPNHCATRTRDIHFVDILLCL